MCRVLNWIYVKLLPENSKCDKWDLSCLEPNIKIHEDAVHAKSTRYECHFCKYFSFRKTGLQNHIKVVHEKYRPHKCDLCEMTFTYKRDKIKHMAKHPNTTTTVLTQTYMSSLSGEVNRPVGKLVNPTSLQGTELYLCKINIKD